ncbi:MAG: ABC transporter ATP-binding protein [Acidothermaceae bacterium]
MSSNGTVVANRIWKRFREDRRPTTLRDRLNPSSLSFKKKHRWALRDVDFKVSPGDSIGLMGINGSGKSTLLKVLTRVMAPYAGSVDIAGRVGALIEVRAGIHPELSGRENVYLYGSLLGLTRKKVAARFDDIVEFAELSKAIDRQVKFYSTGMQMRLGFAVAAFLEPDVLLVDEVLAVGDAAFQQRCLDRMREVLQNGTTLVIVSHDLASLEAMCSRGLWLQDGVLRSDAPMGQVLSEYRTALDAYVLSGSYSDGAMRIVEATVTRPDGLLPATGEPFVVSLRLKTEARCNGRLFLGVSSGTASAIFVVSHYLELPEGETRIVCAVDDLPVARGRYTLLCGMVSMSGRDVLPWHQSVVFDVGGPGLDQAPRAVVRLAPIQLKSSWTYDRFED